VKQWPILKFFACNIKKEVDAKVCSFGYLTLMLSLHYLAEIVVWPLTTMNSYWVVHASAQKITKTTKTLKSCYFVFFKIVSKQAEMTHQQRVGRCESWSNCTCCFQVVSSSTACIHAGGGHFEHLL